MRIRSRNAFTTSLCFHRARTSSKGSHIFLTLFSEVVPLVAIAEFKVVQYPERQRLLDKQRGIALRTRYKLTLPFTLDICEYI